MHATFFCNQIQNYLCEQVASITIIVFVNLSNCSCFIYILFAIQTCYTNFDEGSRTEVITEPDGLRAESTIFAGAGPGVRILNNNQSRSEIFKFYRSRITRL